MYILCTSQRESNLWYTKYHINIPVPGIWYLVYDTSYTHYYHNACHPAMCSMSVNVGHSKHSWKKKSPETKVSYDICTRFIYLSCLHSSLCYIYDTQCVVFAPPSISICALYFLFFCPSMLYLRYSMCCLCSPLYISIYLRSLLSVPKSYKPHPSSIPTPSVWVCHTCTYYTCEYVSFFLILGMLE